MILRTWTAVDACGNETTCDQIITIIDEAAPVLTCAPDITISCDEENGPSTTGEATATDNCSNTGNITITFEDRNGGALTECDGTTGVIVRVWTAVDECGNESTCEQIITVIDDEIPNLICPPDVTLSCDQATDPSIAGGSAIAADNCTPTEDITITFVDVNGGTLSDCGGNAGTITRIWTAVDACGNEATCEPVSYTHLTLPTICSV